MSYLEENTGTAGYLISGGKNISVTPLFSGQDSISVLFSGDDEKKRFIEALEYISKVTRDGMNSDEVNRNAAVIANYVCNIDSDNREFKRLFGFKQIEDSSEEKWTEKFSNMAASERSFILGDMKLKACIFLLRAENFCRRLNSEKPSYESYMENILDVDLAHIASVLDHIDSRGVRTLRSWLDWCKEKNQDKRDMQRLLEWIATQDTGDKTASDKEKNRKDLSDKAQKYIGLCIDFVEDIRVMGLPFDLEIKKMLKTRAMGCAEKARAIERSLLTDDSEKEPSSGDKNNSPAVLDHFEYINSIEKDLSSASYYLFDNSMNEVQFIGFEHYWLWRYLRDKKTIFRCVGTDEFTTYKDDNALFYDLSSGSGRAYYKHMIKNIVAHMNTGNSNKLSSYSGKPVHDIFKYMGLKKQHDYMIVCDYSRDDNGKIRPGVPEIKEGCQYDNAPGTCIFAMVRNADLNIVRAMQQSGDKGDFSLDKVNYRCASGEAYNFTQLVSGEVPQGIYAFCVYVLSNYAPPTRRETSSNIKDLFQNYTSHFPLDIQGLQRTVVAPSDDEVVMMGSTCGGVVEWYEGLSWDSVQDNVEYRVNLTFDEIVGLFWRISEMKNGETVSAPQIVLKNGEPNFEFEKDELKGVKLSIKCENQQNDKPLGSEERKKISEAIRGMLCEAAKEKAQKSERKLDFIMDFIQKTNSSTEYVRKVYSRDNRDPLLDLYRFVLL